MNINEQKSVAKEVLDKIRCLDSRAIIAGGAPRDWYFDNIASDIDIFYYFNTDEYHSNDVRQQIKILQCLTGVEEIEVLGFKVNETHKNEPENDFNNYLKNPNIKNVYEFLYKGVKFQLISLTKRNVDVSTFAYNMCQAWSDGDYIKVSMLFDTGVEKKILIETGELYSNTEKFKMKMVSKFPDYTYIKI